MSMWLVHQVIDHSLHCYLLKIFLSTRQLTKPKLDEILWKDFTDHLTTTSLMCANGTFLEGGEKKKTAAVVSRIWHLP